ncbi:MAG: SdpI family protein [Gemmatimonadota bacterium]|nr:SdpI family protein [Gemmatimonadota bacterium]
MEETVDATVDVNAPDRSRWYPWYVGVVLACAAAASGIVYSRLPAITPTHWNLNGQPDKYGSALALVASMPVVMVAIALLARLLPVIDPLRANYEKFLPTYRLVFAMVLTVLLAIHLTVLALALGVAVPMDRVAPASIGLLFVLLGNVLPRARRNWMFGIRTPWTLSSDRVWERTHRMGGYVMTGAGVIMLLALLFVRGRNAMIVVPGIAITAVAVCVIYSYAAWRQESH